MVEEKEPYQRTNPKQREREIETDSVESRDDSYEKMVKDRRGGERNTVI